MTARALALLAGGEPVAPGEQSDPLEWVALILMRRMRISGACATDLAPQVLCDLELKVIGECIGTVDFRAAAGVRYVLDALRRAVESVETPPWLIRRISFSIGTGSGATWRVVPLPGGEDQTYWFSVTCEEWPDVVPPLRVEVMRGVPDPLPNTEVYFDPEPPPASS